MSNVDWNAHDQLKERLEAIGIVAQHFVGVGEWEHLLVDLTRFLRSETLDREQAVGVLIGWAASWPWGAVEALEFTMRELRWPEVHEFLVEQRTESADFRHRDLAASVLEVFEPEWPGGVIYRTYDPDSA
ncbi:MAG: hypothetical protein AAF531_11965 [Actinomycetota bacterium]